LLALGIAVVVATGLNLAVDKVNLLTVADSCQQLDRLLRGSELAARNFRCGSRLCENAAKTITRLHSGSQWLLIGPAEQQGLQ
jgi:hypothetical protein